MNLIYGWVSPQIQSNFAAWSTWSERGDEESAKKFYEETVAKALSHNLTWFCCEYK